MTRSPIACTLDAAQSVGRARSALVALLIVATGLFAYGVLRERSLTRGEHRESAVQRAHEGAAIKNSESPAKRASESAAANRREIPTERAGESTAANAIETHSSGGGESSAKAGNVSATPTGGSETAAQKLREGRVLGVDLESTPMIVLAIVAGVALAILAASPGGSVHAILFGLAVGALAWSALDVREVVHQAGESRADLAIVAGVVAALHAAAAALAVWLTRRQSGVQPHVVVPTSSGAAPG